MYNIATNLFKYLQSNYLLVTFVPLKYCWVLKLADKPSGLGGGGKGKSYPIGPILIAKLSSGSSGVPNCSVEVRTLPLQRLRSLKLEGDEIWQTYPPVSGVGIQG